MSWGRPAGAGGRDAGAVRLPVPGMFGGDASRSARPPGAGAVASPVRRAIVFLVLAGLAAVVLAKIRLIGGALPVRSPVVAAVTFENVGYGLLGVSVTKRIAQRGRPAVRASGVFAIVKLKLSSTDGKPHLSSADLLALDADGTYYGVSTPDDIGMVDGRWGAVSSTTQVPAAGSLTVKAVFDVPAGLLQRPLALHIGQVGYAAQASARTLRLATGVICCASARPPPSRRPELLGRLLPDPVLGFAPPPG